MNFLTDNKRMLEKDQVGVLEGIEDTSNWTSQRYIEEAQDRLIAHLMSELKKHNQEKLDKIDYDQQILRNLTTIF